MGYSRKNEYRIGDMECIKCNTMMLEVSHKEITQKLLSRPFYYSKWFKCPECNLLLNRVEDKVHNSGDIQKELDITPLF